MVSFFNDVKDEINFFNKINQNNFININIVLAADFAVGKTAFILRLNHKNYKDYMKYDSSLHATIGLQSYSFF